MLILTRSYGQKIMVGDDIVITILRSQRKGQVRLGIDAPKNVAVDREEIAERKKAEGSHAI